MGGTGPEIVTWVGDLGGGTARLARARVKAPGTSASISFMGSDYGGSINLEGDIAGYVVASGGSPTLSAPNIPAGKRLSDALQDYLSPGTVGSAWKDRAKTFLAMNGGAFDVSGALTNRVTLIAAFSAKFQVFACNYLASRVNDNHLTSATAKAAASHVIPASEEIAETFINALEDSLKTGSKIEARRFPAAKSAKPGACTLQIAAASGASLFAPGASVDEEEKEPTPVQRQAASAAGADIPSDHDVIPADSPGQPLDYGTRSFMEPALGRDFSNVRVHTDSRAAQSADALAANAYTTGRDIYFAAGKYAPASRDGEHLLAHELTHTVQQTNGAMPVAANRAGDVMVGDAADPLEAEAERAAEGVSKGEATVAKETTQHLAESTAYSVVQRQPAPLAPPANATPAPAPTSPPATVSPQAAPAATKLRPVPDGEIVKSLDGVDLVADEAFMRYQLEELTIKRNGNAPRVFLDLLERDYQTDEMAGDRAFKKNYEASGGQVSAGVPRSQEDFDAYDQMKTKELRVVEVVRPVVAALERERSQFITDFEKQAKDTALSTLKESETEEKAEALRYGIEWKTIERQVSDCLFGDCKIVETTYSMGGQSPMLTGLQAAAQLLLQRRRERDEAGEKWLTAVAESEDGAGVDVFERRSAASERYNEKTRAYDLMSGYLSQKYPILNAFSDPDPDASTTDLEKLANQKAGPDLAALLGQQIVERLTNIEKVRKGLDDRSEINTWRLPKLVGLTMRQTGADVDPLKEKWVNDQVEAEQPGILETIALLVLNIVALALAAPTGGLSLAVAAGVNAVVAAEHVKDYLTQEALTGTAFDKAHVLSQDDPSFFWLAVEIVGVAIDAAAAFKAISAAAKAVEAVEGAHDAARLTEETSKLKTVAKDYVGEKVAQQIVDQVGEKAGAESKALKALNVTDDETKLLEAGGRAAEEELGAGVASGRATTGGPVKISRAGHIYSCSSPCEYMLEKYRDILGSELKLEGEASTLKEEYLQLEKRAAKAAEDVRVSPPNQLAKAEESAAALEKEIAEFDQKLGRELAYSNATKKLNDLYPDVAEKFIKLDKSSVVRMAGLDADALEPLSKLEFEALKKFSELPEAALKNLAKLDNASLKALAEMEPAALKQLENAKDLDISTKLGSREPWQGSGKPPQWDNPKGKVYKHVVSEHGAERLKSVNRVWDRMRNTHLPQGIWRENSLIVDAEKVAPPFKGQYIIDMGKDIGDVFELDGSITKGVSKFFLRRGPEGELISAYPISEKFTGW